MLHHYLTIAFRNLWKNKAYSFLNTAGLAIGMACSILILLWVEDERSYDAFHEDAADIYFIRENQTTRAVRFTPLVPRPVRWPKR
jgi:predicted ferric reductase